MGRKEDIGRFTNSVRWKHLREAPHRNRHVQDVSEHPPVSPGAARLVRAGAETQRGLRKLLEAETEIRPAWGGAGWECLRSGRLCHSGAAAASPGTAAPSGGPPEAQ